MSEAESKQMPAGWQLCKLSDVMRLKNGYAFKSKDYSDSGVPLIRISDIKDGEVVIDKAAYIPDDLVLEDFLVEPGDLLIAMSGATTGKTGVYKGVRPVLQNQRVGNFKIIDETVVNKRYRDYYISSLRKDIEKAAYGGAQPNISSKGIEAFPFPLAPPEQQKRIVAKIEELFSHIDAGIEALKKAKQFLKQYRQSVLKAAVTGELTKEWREANKDKLEPASQLLERILTERHQKWEEQQFEQFNAKGKMPKDDKWKKKYKDGLRPEKSDLDEISSHVIPQDWNLMTADQLTYFLTDGEHATPPRTDEGIPLLSARNVQNGWLSFEKIDHVSAVTHEKLSERLKVKHGDVLLSCSGTVGRSCVAPENSNFSLVRSVAVLRPVLNNGQFMSYCLRSGMLQSQIDKKKTQTAQANIFQGRIKTLLFYVPAVAEQKEIVRVVKEKSESIERLDSEIDIQLLKAEKNKQSVLASAFSGKIIYG